MRAQLVVKFDEQLLSQHSMTRRRPRDLSPQIFRGFLVIPSAGNSQYLVKRLFELLQAVSTPLAVVPDILTLPSIIIEVNS